MEERKDILEMLEKGVITVDEADELIAILDGYDENKEYDKEESKKLKKKIKELYKKIEKWEQETEEKVKESEAYKKTCEVTNNVKDKLVEVYNNKIKPNSKEVGRRLKAGFRKFGEGFKEIFKKKEKEPNEENVIEAEFTEVNNEETKAN